MNEPDPYKSGGPDIILTHEDVPAKHWIETYAGWLNVLLPLKAWVVYKVDLRNHDHNKSWYQGYANQ